MSGPFHHLSWLPFIVGLGSLLFITDGDEDVHPIQECLVPPPSYASGHIDAPLPPADFMVTLNGELQWVVNEQVNPVLTLERGHTYTFDLNAFGDAHPFVINSNANNPFGTAFAGPAYGTLLSFTPGNSLPSTIYYHCTVHYTSMVGSIQLPGGTGCSGDFNSDLVVNSTDFERGPMKGLRISSPMRDSSPSPAISTAGRCSSSE